MRTQRILGVVLVLLSLLLALGCSRAPEQSARELKERYALALLEGVSSGMNVIKAGEVDRDTLDLLDVRIEDGQNIVYAKRCEILVNERDGTASLRLHEVVAVDAGKPARDDTGNPGVLIELEGFTTDPIRIPGLASADHQ